MLNRRAVGWAITVLLIVGAIATTGTAVLVWNSTLSIDQRIGALADVFTAGAFGLAVLAAAVAVLAFQIAIQRPVLVPKLTSDDLQGSIITLRLGRPDSGERAIIRAPDSGRRGEVVPLLVSIENTSDWSARNVAVRLDFKGIRRIPHALGWTVAGRDQVTDEINALQWEGGADFAIHGHWPRPLPALSLNGALFEANVHECGVVVEVVAEGFRKSWTYPIRWRSVVDVMELRDGGVIEGYVGYARGYDWMPAVRVYAVPVQNPSRAKRVDIAEGPSGKYRWFRIDNLEPGDYHVVAYNEGRDVRGAYTRAARDDNPMAGDHTMIGVAVLARELTQNVRVTDWYSDTFPREASFQ
jgi:hypothetical protein